MSLFQRTDTIAIMQDMTLMDNEFMTVFFDNQPACVEDVLNAILPFKATVESVKTQCEYSNIYGHSVIFDIIAKDSDNTAYDIEIQRADKGAIAQRARYHSGMLDTRALPKGKDYSKINDTYVIFITENDVLGENVPIYRIERTINGFNKYFNDGSHIIYVNMSYQGNGTTAIETLINDFRNIHPESIKNNNLHKRFKEIKTTPTDKEVDSMSNLLELKFQEIFKANIAKVREESLEKGIEQGIERGIERGIEKGLEKGRTENSREIAEKMLLTGNFTVDTVASLCSLTIDEVNEIKEKISA